MTIETILNSDMSVAYITDCATSPVSPVQLKVCHRCQRHRWQMEKIFNQKNLNYFIWSPLGSRENIYINFCFQVHFHVSAAWNCSNYLPPVSMTPVANLPLVSLIPLAICHRRRWHRRQICRGYRWHRCQQHKGNWWQNLPLVSLIPVANLPPVSLIPAAICRRCCWHWWCTLTCEYLREFLKKFEMILMLLSGAWGKVIHEKNLKQKISWHCPFKIIMK